MNVEDWLSTTIILLMGLWKKLSVNLKKDSLKTGRQTKERGEEKRETSATLVSTEHASTPVRTC